MVIIPGPSLIQDTSTVRHAMLLHAPEKEKEDEGLLCNLKVHSDSEDVKQ